MKALFRLEPFDTSSLDGRARERLRRALLTSASAVLGRIIAIAGPLISVPLALGYLGHEQYGLWMTVTAIVGMFTFADLGLGNGLMTEISQAEGRGDTQETRRCIASALIALSGVCLILLCLYLIVYPFVAWPRLLNATSVSLARESGIVATACFMSFLANLPLGVVQRVQWGLQEGFRSHLWHCAGLVLNVAAILIAVTVKASLPILVLCVTGVTPLVNLVNGIVFFGFQRRHLRPRLQDFHWATARRLLRTGFWFLLVSILTAIGIYSDNVVVAQVVGLGTVPLYSIPASLAGYLAALAGMVTAPFWTANGEALARGDVAWVRRNTVRLVRLNVLLTAFAGSAFIVAGPAFLHWWIAPDFTPGRLLLSGMTAWALLLSGAGPLFMVLNGANAIRVQAVIFGLFAPTAILLKVFFAHLLGIAGVAWASVIPYALLVLPAVIWATKRVLLRSGGPSPQRSAEAGSLVPPAKATMGAS